MKSPRLQALKPDELETFWAEVSSPLVEDIPDDDSYVWLTFLWRAPKAVDNVVVFGGPAGWDLPHNQLRHFEGTDVWYRTYKVRTNLRCAYQLSVDDPLTSLDEADDWNARTAGWTADPLNPSTFVIPEDELTDTRETVMSVIEMPDAPEQPWIEPQNGVRSGHYVCRRGGIADGLIGLSR